MRAVVVTGSREWTRSTEVFDVLDGRLPDLVIHGDCETGADRIADGVAGQLDLQCLPMRAQWVKYGRSAGPIRNGHMVSVAVSLRACGWQVTCEAFPLATSKGTWDCMSKMRAAGFEVNNHGDER